MGTMFADHMGPYSELIGGLRKFLAKDPLTWGSLNNALMDEGGQPHHAYFQRYSP